MSESTCPKCRAAEIYTAFRGEKVFDCGSRLAACVGGWEFASQSEWCRIAELEAENARLRAALEKIEGSSRSWYGGATTGDGHATCIGIAATTLAGKGA